MLRHKVKKNHSAIVHLQRRAAMKSQARMNAQTATMTTINPIQGCGEAGLNAKSVSIPRFYCRGVMFD